MDGFQILCLRVAAAFHPALAPVGVLLAVLGYALGTYGAILCAQMMAGVG